MATESNTIKVNLEKMEAIKGRLNEALKMETNMWNEFITVFEEAEPYVDGSITTALNNGIDRIKLLLANFESIEYGFENLIDERKNRALSIEEDFASQYAQFEDTSSWGF